MDQLTEDMGDFPLTGSLLKQDVWPVVESV